MTPGASKPLFQYLVVVSTTQVEDIIRYTATVGPEAEEAAMNTADVLRAEGAEPKAEPGLWPKDELGCSSSY